MWAVESWFVGLMLGCAATAFVFVRPQLARRLPKTERDPAVQSLVDKLHCQTARCASLLYVVLTFSRLVSRNAAEAPWFVAVFGIALFLLALLSLRNPERVQQLILFHKLAQSLSTLTMGREAAAEYFMSSAVKTPLIMSAALLSTPSTLLIATWSLVELLAALVVSYNNIALLDGGVADANSWLPFYRRAYNELNTLVIIATFLTVCRACLDRTFDELSVIVSNRVRFVSKMTHEIRTPLVGVIGITDMLVSQPDVPRHLARHLQVAHASGARLLDLVNNVLDLTKIDAHKMVLVQKQFSLSKFIAGVFNIFVANAQTKGIQLLSEIAHDVPDIVYGDELRLQQVLCNLIGNACKFTQQGSVKLRVTLHTPPVKVLSRTERAWELITVAYTKGVCMVDGGQPASTAPFDDSLKIMHVNFDVVDTGVGIPASFHNSVFLPFSQAPGQPTAPTDPKGTGLGLTLVKELVAMMHGKVRMTSTEGKGSTFSFTARFLAPLVPSAPSDISTLELSSTSSLSEHSLSQTPLDRGKRTASDGSPALRSASLAVAAKLPSSPRAASPPSPTPQAAVGALVRAIAGTVTAVAAPSALAPRSPAAIAHTGDDDNNDINNENDENDQEEDDDDSHTLAADATLQSLLLEDDESASGCKDAPQNTRKDSVGSDASSVSSRDSGLTSSRTSSVSSRDSGLASSTTSSGSSSRSSSGSLLRSARLSIDVNTPPTLLTPPRSALSSAPSTPRTPNESADVLLVDDNVINLFVLKTQLQMLGLRCHTAADGFESVQFVRSSLGLDGNCASNNSNNGDSSSSSGKRPVPTLIFMDICMPGMDGLQATAKIRELEQEATQRGDYSGKITIIALSAAIEEHVNKDCAGVDVYVAKPCTLATLRKVLAGLGFINDTMKLKCA